MTSNPLDACLHLLADRHRRQVLRHLRREVDGTTTFEELVDELHGRSQDAKDGPGRDREELAIRLEHTHLPKLADHGVVEVDHRSEAVRYRPDERVEAVLDSLSREVSLPNA